MTTCTTRMLYGLIFYIKTSVNLPDKPVWRSLTLLPSTKLQHMDLFLLVLHVCPNHNVALLVLQVLLRWSIIEEVTAVILQVGGALAFKFHVLMAQAATEEQPRNATTRSVMASEASSKTDLSVCSANSTQAS